MGDIPATHYSGLIDKKRNGKLTLDEFGVSFTAGRHRAGVPWPDVTSVSLDDPGRTKANVAALAVFGVLAVGSRNSYSLLTVAFSGQQAYLTTQFAIGTWRSVAPQIWHDVPLARGKLYLEGVQVSERGVVQQNAAGDPAALDVPDMIRRLAELRDSGVLTDDEFASKKAELLRRL